MSMTMRWPIAMGALLAWWLGPAGAPEVRAEEAALARHVQAGEALLEVAARGQADAATQALAAFDGALALDPGHAGARAGRGLALIAQAMHAPLAEKLPLARAGCAELDAAVEAAPHDHTLRLRRATSAVHVPRLLGRQPVAEADFALLLAAARDDRVTMPASTRRGIFYQAAAFALKERRAGAADLLEEAASVRADRPSDEQIQSMLALARRQPSSPNDADRPPPQETPAPRPRARPRDRGRNPGPPQTPRRRDLQGVRA